MRRQAIALVATAFALAACGHDATPGPTGPPDLAAPGDASSGPEDADAVDAADASSAAPALGFGATTIPGGVTFRVWAPNADAVYVAGDFNGFDQNTNSLVPESDGAFATTVAGAHSGQRYRYYVHTAGSVYERSDPRARALDDVDGDSIIIDPTEYVWTTPAFSPPPRSEQILYELHLGTFNVVAGQTHGTYQSAIAKLDHLKALGINMIEILPVHEYRGARSWGYNPGAPFAVESSLGTPHDFRALVDAAHARGIGVIVDVVHNHYDRNSPLKCWDGDCLGKNGIYFYADARASTDWGPRPDFGRAHIRDYIVDNATLWLSEYRCDGMRWDSTVNIRKGGGGDIPEGWDLLKRINDTLDATFPNAIQIAEDWQGGDSITRSTAAGGAGFDSQWDGFMHDVNTQILASTDGARNTYTVASAVTRRPAGHIVERVIFTESHDEVANGKKRIPEMISLGEPGSLAARRRSTLGAALALTGAGIPMLFMGQEMLMDKWFSDTIALDWGRATTYAGIVKLYRDLIHLRKNAGGDTVGLTGDGADAFHINDGAKVLAFRRWKAGDDDVVVVANLSGTTFPHYEIGLPQPGTWRVRFNSDAQIYSPDFTNTIVGDVVSQAVARDGLANKGAVALGPYSVLVLSR